MMFFPNRELIALSVKQPWAELIISGEKSVEVRSWKTDYRGALLIHASTHWDGPRHGLHLPLGGIVGRVELDDCVALNPQRWRELADRHRISLPWDQKFRYGFFLSRPVRLEFKRCAGRPLLFVPRYVATITSKKHV